MITSDNIKADMMQQRNYLVFEPGSYVFRWNLQHSVSKMRLFLDTYIPAIVLYCIPAIDYDYLFELNVCPFDTNFARHNATMSPQDAETSCLRIHILSSESQ